MALETNTQNIGTSATELGTSRGRRKALLIRNPSGSGATIYVGAPDVTVAEALFVVAAGDPTLYITGSEGDSLGGEQWSARTASGTATGVVVGEV